MIQRPLFSILLFCLSILSITATAANLAQADRAGITTSRPAEARFVAGQDCLKKPDIPCAQVALAGINPASPYAKLLEAQIAAVQRDHDSVLRLLLPLQSRHDLIPPAAAGLHTTLAQAYENQDNPLRAIQHLILAERWLSSAEEVAANQRHIWQMLSAHSRESLLEMRGESPNTQVQGWIDLALIRQGQADNTAASEQWRMAYPDHPAMENRLVAIPGHGSPVASPSTSGLGKIAILLPIDSPVYGRFAEAVLAGFMAAKENAEVKVYATAGSKEEIAATYRQAIDQGARHVVGPLTREEVSALNVQNIVTVETLALNVVEQPTAVSQKLFMFGLPVEAEAEQVARLARAQGMQSAIIVAAETPLGKRMAQVFIQSWLQQQGRIVYQAGFSDPSNFEELKANLSGRPADMIFLAANATQAQLVRPFLDQAIPTYGLSHIYDGNPHNLLNAPLAAVQFVDMPWLVDHENPEYARYRQAAEPFTPGAEQRWFAVGVDAWRMLSALNSQDHGAIKLPGLSGRLSLQGQVFERQLPLAQFQHDGIRLVQSP